MFCKRHKYKGVFLAELIVSATVLGTILICFTLFLHGTAKFNRFQLLRQQCIAAAQAQLDSLTITGQSISDEDFKRLWPKINIDTKQSDGTGQWEGMKLVEVAASGMSFDTPVKVQLSRYIITDTAIANQEQ